MTDASMNQGAQGSIVQRDHATWTEKHKPNVVALIAHAARQSGRGAFSVGLEATKLKRGRQKIQFEEYIKFGLYDPARHTQEERDEFITFMLQNACIQVCNDTSWFAVTEDKWISQCLLERDGLPIPKTRAVVDTSGRAYHGTEALHGPEALRDFLTGFDAFPLFGKHNRGLMSVGVFLIEGADEEFVYLREHGAVTYHKFFENFIGKDAFLLQEVVQNHAFLREQTSTLATVRMVNMLTDEGLYVPAAVLKLPSDRNMADNFWRPGNLLCNIDPETGEILTIVGTDGPDLKHHEAHPETGASLIGQRLPHWDELLRVNARVTQLHTPLRYQSTDMAITDDGPVVVEVNAGSSFTLPQYASGKGFMTPKVRGLFRSWGCDFIWE
ncbi:sugar-transfer associated ATP-grasp domain-containing protein [Aestuariicoccus sp. MJ-SS9]|uniref:sugar-transfer associated ATP-grasp domain-containing protein n=1 Tax=Aestuariicoccus sp. MJ-SS9 TaxID=3079855 RepID=UPI002911448E|nr:sugar-transfer associated ATP-grasp domain-containing protein [Aestuariicoccus sp. MJ-SS9]MDU8913622.1 sugar-transfer associated ATP-grasp domain-containing protein [Aestuariicoccus sp. MJ-SS9]